jgi:hypothetical protein
VQAARLVFVRRLVPVDLAAAEAMRAMWRLDTQTVTGDAALFLYAAGQDADADALLPLVGRLDALGTVSLARASSRLGVHGGSWLILLA